MPFHDNTLPDAYISITCDDCGNEIPVMLDDYKTETWHCPICVKIKVTTYATRIDPSAGLYRRANLEMLRSAINRQRRWIEERGGTRQSYVERYGYPGESNQYGDGGIAIFQADHNRLVALQTRLHELTGEWQ